MREEEIIQYFLEVNTTLSFLFGGLTVTVHHNDPCLKLHAQNYLVWMLCGSHGLKALAALSPYKRWEAWSCVAAMVRRTDMTGQRHTSRVVAAKERH